MKRDFHLTLGDDRSCWGKFENNNSHTKDDIAQQFKEQAAAIDATRSIPLKTFVLVRAYRQ